MNDVQPMLVALFVVFASATDIASAVAIIAGLTGALSGVGAVFVQRRDSATRQSDSYVERNLAAMQAYIAVQETEIKSLRAALASCQDALAACLKRRRPN